MKRFICFSYGQPGGGMADFSGYAETLDAAKASTTPDEYGQIFDTDTGIVFVREPDGKWETSAISYNDPATFETPELWTHLKRGGLYLIVFESATMQFNGEHVDNTEMVVYRSVLDGKVWTRPKSQFFDGRFTKMDFRNMTIQEMVTETARAIIRESIQIAMKNPELQAIIEAETDGLRAPEIETQNRTTVYGHGDD